MTPRARVVLTRTILLLFAASLVSAQAGIIRVSPSGNDTASGGDWNTAKRSVTAALAIATAGDEVWVAAGAYAERVTIPDGVRLYGGFAGDETQRDPRDWLARPSTLDGRQGGVVVLIQNGAGPNTRLDGFHITGGKGIHGG